MTQAQVVIVPPAQDPHGHVSVFVRRCVVWGIDFLFDSGDRLPARLPTDLEGVRAIFIDQTRVAEHQETLDALRERGVAIYVMSLHADAAIPNATQSWESVKVLHMATVDAGLGLGTEACRRRRLLRDESLQLSALTKRLCEAGESLPPRWYDATRYNWEALVDVSDVTGEPQYRQLALRQMRQMMQRVANDLGDCDCVAPFLPMLRVAGDAGDKAMIAFVIDHVDRYLAQTPRYRGCLVNFNTFAHHVRSEILWQVLPTLLQLGLALDSRAYQVIAWDQFERLRDLLYDRQTRLWRHGLGPAGPTDAYWSRGAAFTLLGTLELIEMTPPTEAIHPLLREMLRDGCEAVGRLQRSDGFFSAVLDDPRTQPESSGTAWIAALLLRGVRLGYLEPAMVRCARLAYDAMRTRIWDGDFPGHMTATTASLVPGYYHSIALSDTGWPHFPLRAMCERRRVGHFQASFV